MIEISRKQRIKTIMLMLLIAFIWGSAFAAQQIAAEHVGAFMIIGIRFLGAAFLLLVLIGFKLKIPRNLWASTALVGFFLFAGSAFQQVAIVLTTVRNAGFITGMYVIFTPFILWIFWRLRFGWNVWAAVLLACGGLYLLTSSPEAVFTMGDLLLLVCAIMYAFHIIFLSKLVRQADLVHVIIGQFLVSGILGLVSGLLFESNSWEGVRAGVWAIAYITVFSSTIAFTLQGVAQKTAEPTDVAIFLSTEAIFAALVGAVVLREAMTPWQLLGCAFLFTGMVISQLPVRQKLATGAVAVQKQTQ